MELWFQNLCLLWGIALVLWCLSVKLKDSSIVDMFWGMFFVVSAWHFLMHVPFITKRAILITFCTTLWGLRLSGYIFVRNFKKGEDKRYAAMRSNDPEKYWWKSLFKIFLLQSTLASVLCLPMYLGITSVNSPLRWFEFFGLALFYFGFLWEAQADWQLSQFKLNRKDKNEILNEGLWALSRHPNYFGEIILWYGFAGIVLSTPQSWMAVLAAISMNCLIIYFSGVKPLEKLMTSRESKYYDYIQSVPVLVPWKIFSKKSTIKK